MHVEVKRWICKKRNEGRFFFETATSTYVFIRVAYLKQINDHLLLIPPTLFAASFLLRQFSTKYENEK